MILGPPPGPTPPIKRSAASRKHRRDVVDSLFNVEIEAIVEVAIKRALAGDGDMARFILGRVSPARKSRPIEVPGGLRPIRTVQDAVQEMARMSELCASGQLHVEEASAIVELLRTFIASSDIADLAARVEALERAK